MTRTQIVQAGILQAQRDDCATLANGWLQRWLNSVAASHPWPRLQRETNGLSLSASSLVVGSGSGGVTEGIIRVLDNVWVYSGDRTKYGRVRVRTQLTSPADRVGSVSYGMPSQLRAFNSGEYQWTLYFDVTPDQTYSLSLPYITLGTQLVDDTSIPWYPNDETMIQAVAFNTARYFDGKDSDKCQALQEDLVGLFASDRLRYGSANGVNDLLQLNPARFPNANKP